MMRGPAKGAKSNVPTRDAHTCQEEIASTIRRPTGEQTEEVTTRFRCRTCSRDMGSETATAQRIW